MRRSQPHRPAVSQAGTNLGYIPHDLTQVPTPVPVFFSMDAWGNLYDDLPVEYCPRDSGVEVTKDLQGGKYQYHGSDGYQTDLLGPIYNPNQEERGRSTRFVYIGARFYDPATGRFLQADSVPIDPIPCTWGQNNKWTYAANDPMNLFDPDGQSAAAATREAAREIVVMHLLALVVIIAIARIIGLPIELARPRRSCPKEDCYCYCMSKDGRGTEHGPYQQGWMTRSKCKSIPLWNTMYVRCFCDGDGK